jgi:hypothetical protein
MDRRNFLRLCAGAAGVTAATMAQAGFWSEFLSWLKRKPVHSIPLNATITQYADFVSYTEASLLTSEELLPELGPLMTIYYDRQAIKNLEANLRFDKMCEQRASRIFYSGTKLNTSHDWDAISLPRSFPDGTKAVKFGKIWKPVCETKDGKLVVV